jgi:hypothetical protein
LIAPRPEYLETADERLARTRIDAMQAGLPDASDPAAAALRPRLLRLRGVLTWNLETQYPERLTEAHVHLRALNEDVDAMTAHYDAFVRARQAATHGYIGYDAQIEKLRTRVGEALERLEVLMPQQGQILETVASEELGARRERLGAYQNQARFAFADSHDRAATTQAQ